MDKESAEELKEFAGEILEMLRSGKTIFELARKGLLAPVYAYFGVSMKIEAHVPDVLKEMEQEDYVDLDFLGYAVARHPEASKVADEAVYLAVLSKERLYKMLAFSKTEYGNSRITGLSREVRPLVASL